MPKGQETGAGETVDTGAEGNGAAAKDGGTADLGRQAAPTVNWDDSNMRTSYANVVNAASTREEVTLFFGTNQTWNLTDKQELNVLLSERIVVSPYAAKRLWTILGAVLTEYERRFGPLKLDIGGDPGTP